MKRLTVSAVLTAAVAALAFAATYSVALTVISVLEPRVVYTVEDPCPGCCERMDYWNCEEER